MIEQASKVDSAGAFTAKPIPRCVSEARFAALIREEDERRAKVRAESKDVTLRTQRPFSFYHRDIEKRKVREDKIESMRRAEDEAAKAACASFRASDVPKYITQREDFQTVIRTREIIQQQRHAERASSLLRQSKLPPRMQRHVDRAQSSGHAQAGAYFDLALGERNALHQDPNCTFSPHINREVPDFKGLQTRFHAELERKKASMPRTRVQEFKIGSARPESLDQVLMDIELDNLVLPENRWPFLGPRSVDHRKGVPTFAPVAPPKTTTAATLRARENAQKLYFLTHKGEIEEQERARLQSHRQRLRNQALKKAASRGILSERSRMSDLTFMHRLEITEHKAKAKAVYEAALDDNNIEL